MAGLGEELRTGGAASGGLDLEVAVERWPIRGGFTISRGTKHEAVVVVAAIGDGVHTGRGECVPYARYGETVEGVVAAIEARADAIASGLSRTELASLLPAGAARNALDCALWDLEAKRAGRSAAALAGIGSLQPVLTAFTLSLGTPEDMAAKARKASAYPLLKLKLGGDGDEARLAAVREAVPQARLIVDANEAWQASELESLLAAAAAARVELIEQPLPSGRDDLLARIERPIPVCADESVHDRASLATLAGRYDAVNIKLDKTGGLTEALLLAEEARSLGIKIMVGSMVATSLAMAPALLVAQDADWVDLDGPLLLARDRVPGLTYEAGMVFPPPPELWG
ncbi:MAG TPA: N-acetyl-D-Glu racemase DgcA [Methyloceanibacter sp.]|jgi:L-alanine-DL-glutamate epimerase-like enolase superfamily enzyme|nr:N-acetyl-D-Glu racemase DgcA [Methyloceanibacter sp.]